MSSVQDIQHSSSFSVAPSDHGEKLDASDWPLLLKVDTLLNFSLDIVRKMEIVLFLNFNAFLN